MPALNDCCVGAPGVEDRLKSGVKEVLTVNIFDTVKKIFVAGSADKGGGPSLEDRMDGFWLDTDMTPFWTCAHDAHFCALLLARACRRAVLSLLRLWPGNTSIRM